jgi:8-oxo-dGTP diphosphatase
MLLDGKVVLARHRTGTSTYHLLPGGGVGYRETVEEALVREIREETGLHARLSRLLFINDTIDPNGWRHLVNLTFLAEVTGGEITSDPKDARVEAVDLMEPEALGELDLRPPLAPYIAQAFADGLENAPARYLGSLFSDPKPA